MQNNPIEFLKEAAIMHSIDNEHIVRLYGVVLDTDALMLVMNNLFDINNLYLFFPSYNRQPGGSALALLPPGQIIYT